MLKVFYKPFALIASILGGLVAGAIFNKLWTLLPGEGDAPNPDDEGSDWPKVLASAAVHGAVFGTVKAVTKRAGATGFARATGTWPGKTVDE